MTSFQYTAIHITDKSRTQGIISAPDLRQARELLREQQLVVTRIEAVAIRRQVHTIGFMHKLIGVFQKPDAKDVIVFSKNMAMMLRNGLAITEAMMYFETYLKKASFRQVIAQLRKDITNGLTLSDALGKHPRLFDTTYLNVVRAGEASGELDQTLTRLTDLLERSQKIKKKVISAMVYPGIVLGISGLVLLVIFTIVLPTFVGIYEQMGVELPLITEIMVAISHFLTHWWFVAFPLLGGCGFGLFSWYHSDMGKTVMDRVNLTVPVLNELTVFMNSSQFIASMAVGFSAGIPITEVLFLASNTVRNHIIRNAFMKMNLKVQSGQRLGPSLAETGFIPNWVLVMISTGEESGDLERMLHNSVEYLEEEINHRIEILMSFMEPLLLLLLGGVVGFTALGIYLPLFGMYENL
jgi:type II secretory pathway component PulF